MSRSGARWRSSVSLASAIDARSSSGISVGRSAKQVAGDMEGPDEVMKCFHVVLDSSKCDLDNWYPRLL